MLRRADAIISLSEMLKIIINLAEDYGPFEKGNLSRSLDDMVVMSAVLLATDRDQPLNALQLAKRLSIKHTTVRRVLARLIERGCVKRIGHVYVAELAAFDKILDLETLDRTLARLVDAMRNLQKSRAAYVADQPEIFTESKRALHKKN